MEESSRLKYQIMSETDFDIFYRIHADEQVMYYAYLDAFESEDKARAFFEHILQSNKSVIFIVYEKQSDRPIGIVDYMYGDGAEDDIEIGYFLLPEYWGHGYGFEMSSWIINYVFRNTQCKRVIATCHCENKKSENLMKKLGMKYQSTETNARLKRNKYVDELKYGLNKLGD